VSSVQSCSSRPPCCPAGLHRGGDVKRGRDLMEQFFFNDLEGARFSAICRRRPWTGAEHSHSGGFLYPTYFFTVTKILVINKEPWGTDIVLSITINKPLNSCFLGLITWTVQLLSKCISYYCRRRIFFIQETIPASTKHTLDSLMCVLIRLWGRLPQQITYIFTSPLIINHHLLSEVTTHSYRFSVGYFKFELTNINHLEVEGVWFRTLGETLTPCIMQ
jgi:hypothetical protein